MIKIISLFYLFFISLFFCNHVYAVGVNFQNTESPYVAMAKNSSAQVVVDAASASESSSTDPYIAYIPVDDGINVNTNYSILTDPTNTMPLYTTSWQGSISLQLTLDNTGGTNPTYLWAATQGASASTYNLIGSTYIASVGGEIVNGTYTFSIKDFCDKAGCGSSIQTLDRQVIFFLSASTPGADFSADPTSLYVKFKFSSVVNTQAPVIDRLRKGDERLTLFYSNAPILSYYYETVIFSYDDTSVVQAASTYDAISASGSIVEQIATSTQETSGYLTLANLQNGESVNVALAVVDKFYFASTFSASKIGAPEMIDVFLKRQGCFLLSAGFQEEHYVIEYFKKIRDQVLLKNYFGKKFVNFYYNTAPKYTHAIYNNPNLSFFVRGVGYSMYFILNYFFYLVFALLVLSGLALGFLSKKSFVKIRKN